MPIVVVVVVDTVEASVVEAMAEAALVLAAPVDDTV